MPFPPPKKKKPNTDTSGVPTNQIPGDTPGPGASPPGMGMGMMPPGMMGGSPLDGLAQQAPLMQTPDARPGRGMDALRAMISGLGPDPLAAGYPPAQTAPLGPEGLPIGASLPGMLNDNDADDTMGGSSLIQALARAAGGNSSDPYTQPPGGSEIGFQGMGTGDPQMGLEPLLKLLALAKMGVGGQGPRPAGSSGLDMPPNDIGGMMSLGGGPAY